MLKLYNAPHSTCSQKVRICLHEKGLAFEDIKLDLGKAKDQLKPEYLKLNPNGVVPTLVDDDDIIIDSSVICEYLDEKYPSPKLTPDDVVERAKMRAWMRYLEEVPTVAVRVPSFNMGFLPRFAGLDDERFRAEQSDVRPIRKHFYRRMTQTGFKRADSSVRERVRHSGKPITPARECRRPISCSPQSSIDENGHRRAASASAPNTENTNGLRSRLYSPASRPA